MCAESFPPSLFNHFLERGNRVFESSFCYEPLVGIVLLLVGISFLLHKIFDFFLSCFSFSFVRSFFRNCWCLWCFCGHLFQRSFLSDFFFCLHIFFHDISQVRDKVWGFGHWRWKECFLRISRAKVFRNLESEGGEDE